MQDFEAEGDAEITLLLRLTACSLYIYRAAPLLDPNSTSQARRNIRKEEPQTPRVKRPS